MKNGFVQVFIVIYTLVLFLSADNAFASKTIITTDIDRVTKEHQEWLKDYNTPEMRNNIHAGYDTRYANLKSAVLSDLLISGKNLSFANLRKANLTNSILIGSNFTGADMFDAILIKARLSSANLTGTNLWSADLSRAILVDTELADSDFRKANMSRVVFQPNNLPIIKYIAQAKNLNEMTYWSNPQMLIELRRRFYEGGYSEQERAITHAINHTEFDSSDWESEDALEKIHDIWRYVFFNLPTKWGMYPGRALRILLLLIVLFTLPYVVALRLSMQAGIYLKWNNSHFPADKKNGTWNKYRQNKNHKDHEIERLQYKTYKAILTGFYFSLLSAFNIGFREINVGNWITRIQPHDYTLYATGWVRSVSGIQSLISVYLVAMWVLTYFGRPFG